MPITAPIEKFVHNILALLHYLLASDSEENAIVCLKIIIDLHKTHKKADAKDVNAFIDTVIKFYDQMPSIVERKFTSPAAGNLILIQNTNNNNNNNKQENKRKPFNETTTKAKNFIKKSNKKTKKITKTKIKKSKKIKQI